MTSDSPAYASESNDYMDLSPEEAQEGITCGMFISSSLSVNAVFTYILTRVQHIYANIHILFFIIYVLMCTYYMQVAGQKTSMNYF